MIYWDFCGMGVDMIRAAYKTRMRLRNDSNAETEVQWFKCDKGAKVYPGYTRFASGNWAYDRVNWPGAGEVLGAPRPFVNGKKPKIGLIGRGFCGSHYAIANGANSTSMPLLKRLDGQAKCCPGIEAAMGLMLAPGPYPPLPCTSLPVTLGCTVTDSLGINDPTWNTVASMSRSCVGGASYSGFWTYQKGIITLPGGSLGMIRDISGQWIMSVNRSAIWGGGAGQLVGTFDEFASTGSFTGSVLTVGLVYATVTVTIP